MESNPVPAQPTSTGQGGPNQQPAQAPQPAPAAAPTSPQPEQSGGSKKVLWSIVILIVLGVVAVGGFWFMTRQSAPVPEAVQPTDTASNLSSLKTELDTITDGTESLTNDLTALDKDLSGL